jgi:O-succinylbenzoic acid--CoA ligase
MNSYLKIQLDNVWYTAETIHLFSEKEPEESWRNLVVQFLNEWFNKEPYIEAQTSGSTGEPKSIKLSKQSMVNSAKMTCSFFDLRQNSKALLCLPASYIAGKMMLVRALVSGFNLLTVKPSGNPFSELNTSVDFTAVTPFQLIQSYQSLQEKVIKKMIVGGSSVSQKLQRLIENLNSEIYETYGMTETCSHIALRRLNGENAENLFTILPRVEIHTDERNCLIIKAPALTDTEIVTNDVVEIAGKTHFKWMGRFDHVINSGGIKLFPEQIEKKLEPCLERRFFISTLPDEKLTEKVVLVIEGTAFDEAELMKLSQNMKLVLDPFEMPRGIYFIETFYITSSGKVNKLETFKKI